jgi:hypothetical protein
MKLFMLQISLTRRQVPLHVGYAVEALTYSDCTQASPRRSRRRGPRPHSPVYKALRMASVLPFLSVMRAYEPLFSHRVLALFRVRASFLFGGEG